MTMWSLSLVLATTTTVVQPTKAENWLALQDNTEQVISDINNLPTHNGKLPKVSHTSQWHGMKHSKCGRHLV